MSARLSNASEKLALSLAACDTTKPAAATGISQNKLTVGMGPQSQGLMEKMVLEFAFWTFDPIL